MEYDLAIIGGGFSGLMAAKKARDDNLNFCVIAQDAGASLHFSGAFDVIDPRWQEAGLHPENYPSLEAALRHFIKANPKHLYARLSHADFEKNLVDEMLSFFQFYQVPVLGDGRQMIAVLGSAGEFKPTGFSLSSQGLLPKEVSKQKKVTYIHFPDLGEYPSNIILSRLGQFFSRPDILNCNIFSLNRTAPFAHLLRLLDEEKNQASFLEFLKNLNSEIIFLPPVLGIKNFQSFHKKMESSLGARVVELLSAFPSASGLRFQNCVQTVFETVRICHLKGRVMAFEAKADSVKKITVCDSEERTQDVMAKNFILATGKYLGGGIQFQEKITETVFDLPLFSQGNKVRADAFATQMIRQVALERQPFMDLGVTLKTPYRNLQVCGHVLSGFDFSRDRCGFGVSAASACEAMNALM